MWCVVNTRFHWGSCQSRWLPWTKLFFHSFETKLTCPTTILTMLLSVVAIGFPPQLSKPVRCTYNISVLNKCGTRTTTEKKNLVCYDYFEYIVTQLSEICVNFSIIKSLWISTFFFQLFHVHKCLISSYGPWGNPCNAVCPPQREKCQRSWTRVRCNAVVVTYWLVYWLCCPLALERVPMFAN